MVVKEGRPNLGRSFSYFYIPRGFYESSYLCFSSIRNGVRRMLDREEYRLLRIKKRIRLKELATLLNCHKSHISNYEHGRTGMKEDKIELYKSYIEGQAGKVNE
ncbi:hypothetical protein D3C81_906940 [compost metagenome]